MGTVQKTEKRIGMKCVRMTAKKAAIKTMVTIQKIEKRIVFKWVRKTTKKEIIKTLKRMVRRKTVKLTVEKTVTRVVPEDGRGFHSDHTLAHQTPPPL